MANKWIVLNIFLLIAAVGMGRELYRQYDHFNTKDDPAKIEPVSTENQAAAKNAPDASNDVSTERPVYRDADYFIISEKTLFSDLRGNEEIVPTVAPKVMPLPKPHPVLVGVTVVDGQYAATVRSQPTPQVRGSQVATETWRVGDLYRGYMVTSIERDQIVLENSGVREVLPLNRAARPAQPIRPAAASTTQVTSIGPGSGSSGAISVLTASTPMAGRGAATAAQNANAVARQVQQLQAQQQAQQAQQQQQAKQQAQQQAQQAQQQAQQRVPVTVSTSEGDVVISVPENVQDIIQLRPAQKTQPGANAKPAPGGRLQQRVAPSPFGEIIRPGS